MRNKLFLISLTAFFLVFNSYRMNAQKSSMETAGDIGLFMVPAAAFTITLLKEDRQGTWQFTKGFLLNGALTYGLKVSINKPRPNDHGDFAFPSGHTSTTFQAASFIHKRYGFKYSIPAYAVAGFTAFSRIDTQRHDGWDVLAGAVVGIGSTLLFTTEYQQDHMELTFGSHEGEYLLGFKYKF